MYFNIIKNNDCKQGAPETLIISSFVRFLYGHAWRRPKYRPKHVSHMSRYNLNQNKPALCSTE